MNASQIAACQHFTNKLNRNFHDGNLSFHVEEIEGTGLYIFSASNAASLRWYETTVLVIATIGPRGGFRIRQAEGISVK